jgi:hypothetical protein
MSQSKASTRESRPDGVLRSGHSTRLRHDDLSAKIRTLLDDRARVVEQLALIDRDLDRVRAEATDGALRAAAALRDSAAEQTFSLPVREFVRGTAEPPDAVDRDDFEQCLGKVVLALRRSGERIAGASVQVRYQPSTGRVVSIILERDGGAAAERPLYRRFDLGTSAAG